MQSAVALLCGTRRLESSGVAVNCSVVHVQVAAFVMGSPEPLPVLVERLTACMASADAGNPVTDMLVQNTILELASRKSFGVKDGAVFVCHLPHGRDCKIGSVVDCNIRMW